MEILINGRGVARVALRRRVDRAQWRLDNESMWLIQIRLAEVKWFGVAYLFVFGNDTSDIKAFWIDVMGGLDLKV